MDQAKLLRTKIYKGNATKFIFVNENGQLRFSLNLFYFICKALMVFYWLNMLYMRISKYETTVKIKHVIYMLYTFIFHNHRRPCSYF